MGSLLDGGYRPPQFSEESAWLPCWFQHQHVQPLQDERDAGYRFTNKCTREDAIMSLEDEGRYRSCHLFLSGEDMSSPSLYQSSANVGGLHLHLSSNGITQDFYSSELGTFKAQNKASYNIAIVHETELSASQKVKGTSSLEHAYLLSLEGNNDMRTKNQENVRINDVSEINNAVELSNAAAEALIIHDLAKSSSSAAILEVALRVKQARLQGINDISYCSDDDIDEDESILDFNESDMEDAFEDVGLIFCGSDVDISQVKETPNLEIHSLNDFPVNTFNEQEPADIIDIDNQEKKGVLVEIVGFDGETKVKDNPTSDLTISENVPRNDIDLPSSMVEKNNIPSATVGLYLALQQNITQPLKNAKKICSLQTEGSPTGERDDKLQCSGPDKFQSRWLGGWMRKEEEKASTTTAHKNLYTVPKLLVGETSYLSESADIAPDKNSHIHVHDEGSHIASQPSIQLKALYDKADESIIISPNTQIPSCLSLADPLCSFVPCSLLSENTCPSKDNDLNIVEDTEEFYRPAMDNCNDNLGRTSTSNTEFVFGEQKHVPKINGEASYGTIRRHLTSLSKYSTISPNNSRFISTENNSYARKIEENHKTEIQACLEKDRCSPLILNRRKRFLACEEVDIIDTEKTSRPECDIELRKSDNQKDHLKCGVALNSENPPSKRVRFSGTMQKTGIHKQSSHIECSGAGAGKRVRSSNTKRAKKSQSPHKNAKGLVLQNLEFLLTGFSLQKEREIKILIKKHDGKILHRVPSSNSRGRMISKSSVQYHLVVLCPHKMETTEFLYGCVVNAFILRVDWLTDSIKAGSALATDKYMVIPNRVGGRNVARPLCLNKHDYLFNGVGILLHGKHSYCNRLVTVIKVIIYHGAGHGGGKVFKTLQLMVQNLDTKKISHGIIVAEDERTVSRHLKQCASEGKIHTLAASWIINSLHLGKLLPFNAKKHLSCLPKIRILDFPDSAAFSEEI